MQPKATEGQPTVQVSQLLQTRREYKMDPFLVLDPAFRASLSLGPGIAFLTIVRMVILEFRQDIVDTLTRPTDVDFLTLRNEYDFVIVGGGSAGNVLANRLSENPDWNILLIEAGGDEPPISDVPLAWPILQQGPIDWTFRTEPQPYACQALRDSKSNWPRGKVLGGSSTINGMLYIRGNRRDYDTWAALGNEGWSYTDVLPYFKKSEDIQIPRLQSSPYHGRGGFLTVEEYRYYSPIVDDLVEAGQQAGWTLLDVNGAQQTGFMKAHGTLRNGLRCSTSKAFLRPATRRSNLDVSLFTIVNRVLTEKNHAGFVQATGVSMKKGPLGLPVSVKATREVILSAGAIQSPQLLMLSGVGPAHHLRDVGIDPVVDLRGVGENLQDHIAMGGIAIMIDPPNTDVNQGPGYTFNLPRAMTIRTVLDFVLQEQGPMYEWPEGEIMGFLKTKYANHSDDWPDIQLFLSPGADSADGGIFYKRNVGMTDVDYAAVFDPILFREVFMAVPLLMRPRSRGSIRLRNKDFNTPLMIDPQYLRDSQDARVLREGAKEALKLLNTPAMQKLNARPNPNMFPRCKNFTFLSDDYLECQARQYTMTIYHPVGTCKMGPDNDPYSVVNPRLQVRGIARLRVIDASVMPNIPTGNTNAPTIMIAEKGADMIKQDWIQYG